MARTKKELLSQYLRLFLVIVDAVIAVLALSSFITALALNGAGSIAYAVLPPYDAIRPLDLVIAVSLIVLAGVVVGFFGVCLARKRPGKILLSAHGIVLGCILFVMFAGAIYVLAAEANYDSRARVRINLKDVEGSGQYAGDLFQSWNTLQKQESCCGVHNLTDWFGIEFPGKNSTFNNSVPISCCDPSYGEWSAPDHCTGTDVDRMTVQLYFQKGCGSYVEGMFTYFVNVTAGFCFVLSFLQAISVALTVLVILLLRDQLLDYDDYEPIH